MIVQDFTTSQSITNSNSELRKGDCVLCTKWVVWLLVSVFKFSPENIKNHENSYFSNKEK